MTGNVKVGTGDEEMRFMRMVVRTIKWSAKVL